MLSDKSKEQDHGNAHTQGLSSNLAEALSPKMEFLYPFSCEELLLSCTDYFACVYLQVNYLSREPDKPYTLVCSEYESEIQSLCADGGNLPTQLESSDTFSVKFQLYLLF